MSDRCRWVSLEADGRVLVCMCVDGHRPQFPQHFDKDFSEGSAWVPHDPLAWEADLCWDCDGTGVQHYDGHPRCPTCDGTGLDLTPPLRLVGVGSVLNSNAEADCRCPTEFVVVDEDEHGQRAVCTDCGDWSDVTDRWSVVRAVPPAYTGDA